MLSVPRRGQIADGEPVGGRARAWPQPQPQRGARHSNRREMRTSDVPVLSAAGLIVALSAPLGCAAYISAVDVDPVEWVCETTCLDIVGSWAGGGGATQPKANRQSFPESQTSEVECTGARWVGCRQAGQQECCSCIWLAQIHGLLLQKTGAE